MMDKLRITIEKASEDAPAWLLTINGGDPVLCDCFRAALEAITREILNPEIAFPPNGASTAAWIELLAMEGIMDIAVADDAENPHNRLSTLNEALEMCENHRRVFGESCELIRMQSMIYSMIAFNEEINEGSG